MSVHFERRPGPPTTGGEVSLYVGDTVTAKGDIPRTAAWRMSLDETQDVGEDHGTGVDDSYALPYRYAGDLRKVVVDLR